MFNKVFLTPHFFPPAATWFRSRHSGVLRKNSPRSRSAPLGLSTLTPAEGETVRGANFILECFPWCPEQALACPVEVVSLTIIFPEDLGGHADGPSSIYVNFNSWRASVMPIVPLHTCVSSRWQISNAHLFVWLTSWCTKARSLCRAVVVAPILQ